MTLSESPPGRPPTEGVGARAPPSGGSLTRPDHLPHMPCPLPRWTEPVRLSVSSRLVQPSPQHRRVGVHEFTFEACSGFTRVTACGVARPPDVAFVTRLQLSPFTGLSRLSATRPTDSYLGGTFTHWRSAPLRRTVSSSTTKMTVSFQQGLWETRSTVRPRAWSLSCTNRV